MSACDLFRNAIEASSFMASVSMVEVYFTPNPS